MRLGWSGLGSGLKGTGKRCLSVGMRGDGVDAGGAGGGEQELGGAAGDEVGGRLGRSADGTMFQSEPGSCWRWTVGPVKVSKPQRPRMVPVSRMGWGWGLAGGAAVGSTLGSAQGLGSAVARRPAAVGWDRAGGCGALILLRTRPP